MAGLVSSWKPGYPYTNNLETTLRHAKHACRAVEAGPTAGRAHRQQHEQAAVRIIGLDDLGYACGGYSTERARASD